MAHEIDFSNNRANIAYVGDMPWHGLGHELPANQPLEVWEHVAGLGWEAREGEVYRMVDGEPRVIAGKKVIYRSDTGADLAVMGEDYRLVQPREVLEFYRSLVEGMGYRMETAGSLYGGKRVWALARTGEEATIMGQDRVNGYVLLATSFDGSMATVATRTTVRVVCNNTLNLSVGRDAGNGVSLRHSTKFNASVIKGRLGLETNEVWEKFQRRAQALAERRVSKEEAVKFFVDLYYEGRDVDMEAPRVKSQMLQIVDIYENGVGQSVRSANGTAWGLVNAVTRYVDHERKTRSDDARLQRAWFGDGNQTKTRAFELALKLAA